MKIRNVLLFTGGLLLTLAFSVSAQWMRGGQPGWGGGGFCRMMDVSPHPIDPASLPEPDSLGAKILKHQCTQCHGLVAPSQHAVQDWPRIVERMDRRMRLMGQRRMMMHYPIKPLTPAEKQALLDYLGKYAFHAVAPESLAGGAGAAAAYVNVCSRCHALPDPAAHTAEEWRGIVDRMANNMSDLGMEPMTAQQKKEIVTYLQGQGQH